MVGPIIGALLTAAMSAGMSKMQGGTNREAAMTGGAQGMSKISGIPLPGKTGTALGAEKKRELDAQFPGTNPWEQMKGSPATSGAVQVERQKAKTQKELQSKELATREKIANIGANATVMSAGAQAGPRAVDSLTAKRRAPDQPTGQYMTASMQQAFKTGNEVKFQKALLPFRDRIAMGTVLKSELYNYWTGFANAYEQTVRGEFTGTGASTLARGAATVGGIGIAGWMYKKLLLLRGLFGRGGFTPPMPKPPKTPRGRPGLREKPTRRGQPLPRYNRPLVTPNRSGSPKPKGKPAPRYNRRPGGLSGSAMRNIRKPPRRPKIR